MPYHVEHLAIRGVEEIGREEVTHARVDAKVFRRVNRVTHHVEIRDRCEVVILETHTVHFGVGAGTHTDDDVTQFHIHTHGTAGADADDLFDAKIGDQLFGVDGAGGNTHTVTHYRDFAAFVGAGVAQHAAHVVYFTIIFEKRFGDVLCAQRVARHQYDVREIAHFCIDMWGCHRCFL